MAWCVLPGPDSRRSWGTDDTLMSSPGDADGRPSSRRPVWRASEHRSPPWCARASPAGRCKAAGWPANPAGPPIPGSLKGRAAPRTPSAEQPGPIPCCPGAPGPARCRRVGARARVVRRRRELRSEPSTGTAGRSDRAHCGMTRLRGCGGSTPHVHRNEMSRKGNEALPPHRPVAGQDPRIQRLGLPTRSLAAPSHRRPGNPTRDGCTPMSEGDSQ